MAVAPAANSCSGICSSPAIQRPVTGPPEVSRTGIACTLKRWSGRIRDNVSSAAFAVFTDSGTGAAAAGLDLLNSAAVAAR